MLALRQVSLLCCVVLVSVIVLLCWICCCQSTCCPWFPVSPYRCWWPRCCWSPSCCWQTSCCWHPCLSWIPASHCWRHPCCCWMYCCCRFHSCLSHRCCWPPQPPCCCKSLCSFIAGVVSCLRCSQKNKTFRIIKHCQPHLNKVIAYYINGQKFAIVFANVWKNLKLWECDTHMCLRETSLWKNLQVPWAERLRAIFSL